jgi:hypothetical protein
MGHQVRQLLPTLCVALFHALGDSDLVERFLPSNPELWQTPQQSWGLFQIQLWFPAMHRVRRMRNRMMSKILFTSPVEPSCFASSVVTSRGH